MHARFGSTLRVPGSTQQQIQEPGLDGIGDESQCGTVLAILDHRAPSVLSGITYDTDPGSGGARSRGVLSSEEKRSAVLSDLQFRGGGTAQDSPRRCAIAASSAPTSRGPINSPSSLSVIISQHFRC